MNGRVLVVSIGNRLVGDDAVGPVVHDALAETPLPDGVVLKLLGVGGIALLDELDGQEHLIVVDAVRWGTPAGSIHVTSGNPARDNVGMPVTSHDISLNDALVIGEKLYPEKMPKEILFVGIEGRDFDELGSPLSPPVEAAVPKVVDIVLSQVKEATSSVCEDNHY